jgi:hypothetical protein
VPGTSCRGNQILNFKTSLRVDRGPHWHQYSLHQTPGNVHLTSR